MLKKMIVAALLALMLVPVAASAVHIDGNWFDTGCYGCPGDTVVGEVKAQKAEFESAMVILKLPGGWTTDKILLASELALFSHVKAGQLLEVGRLYRKSGDTANAIKYLNLAVTAAKAAEAMPLNENFKGANGDNVPLKSHSEGKKWRTYAEKWLKELGAGPVESK